MSQHSHATIVQLSIAGHQRHRPRGVGSRGYVSSVNVGGAVLLLVVLMSGCSAGVKARSTPTPPQPGISGPPAGRNCTVAVVGAGWGGLYFAHRLVVQEAAISGSDVCIFEAGERLGGRVYTTETTTESDGQTWVVDVGAYRFQERHRLVKGMIREQLGLNTSCYFPVSCSNDNMQKVVDASGLVNLGYGAPIDMMADELRTAGVSFEFGVRLVGIFESTTGSPSGSTTLALLSPTGTAEFVTAEHVLLNIPDTAIASLDRRSVLFREMGAATGSGISSSFAFSSAKVYVHYSDAWWVTKLGLLEGEFEEAETNPRLQGRYHDGPVHCFDSDGAQVALNSTYATNCSGVLLASYIWDAYEGIYYSPSDALAFYFQHQQPGGPFTRIVNSTDELLTALHHKLMLFHGDRLKQAGVDPSSIPQPDLLLMGTWDSNDPVNPSFHLRDYYSFYTLEDLATGFSKPLEKHNLYIANEAFGITPGWAEGSLIMAERALSYHWGLPRPSWMEGIPYYDDVVLDLGSWVDTYYSQLTGSSQDQIAKPKEPPLYVNINPDLV